MIPLTTKRILKLLDGDKISGKVITFDGNLDGKESYEVQQNFYHVKVSDEVCDLNSIEEIVLLSSMNGSKTFKKKDITVGIDAGVLATIVNGMACVFSANEGNEAGYPKGTFILYISDGEHYEYVSKIQFAETIVPIDPKFLPGVWFPLFNSVLDLGPSEEIEDEMAIEISADFAAELSTKPYAFMARCVCEYEDGALFTTTAMFLPLDLNGIATGWKATVSFGASNDLYIVTVAQMGEQTICQVRRNT